MTHSYTQRGNALFMILLAVALFAALSYAVSQQRDSGTALSSEKIRLYASDILDMGNKMDDTISQMRLRKVPSTQLSFDNTIMTGYVNPTCLTATCRVFSFDGGGRDWETPVTEINNGTDWMYTGNLGIENIGTTDADLVAILPNIPLKICDRINTLIGIYKTGGTPPQFTGLVIDKFIGGYQAVATPVSNVLIQGQKSGCISLRAPSGNGISPSLPNPSYAYYQVLDAR